MPRRVSALQASLATVLLLVALSGCDSEGDLTSLEGNSIVTFDLHGLKPLDEGLNYQAWLVSQSADVLIGTPVVLFDVNEDGQMIHPVADTLISGPWQADVGADNILGVAISLELTTELVAYSSNSFILSGEAVQGNAILTTGDVLAFNRDLSNVSGRYALLTPTDEDPENELNGLWFMDPNSDPEAAGLDVPEAPTGWIYEGWVEVGETVISMGRFTSPMLADSSDAHGGGVAGPPFPGEDFLSNAPQGVTFPLDLTGAAVYVTMEPWLEFDTDLEAPFFLKILEGQVPADPVSLTLYDLISLVDQLPSGTATVQDMS